MACNNCDNTPIVIYNTSSIYTPYCATTPPAHDVKNFVYLGPDLSCIPAYTGNNLELIIQRIDSKICSTLGDYTTYNTACLDDDEPITSEQQFVEVASEFMCTLRTDFNTFKNSTFPGYQSVVDTRFDLIETPRTSNTTIDILSTDSLQDVLTKLALEIEDIINVRLDISDAEFDQCFVVSPLPTTLSGAFNVLIDQICTIKNDLGSADILPTFNNVGTCLPSPLTAADTLTDTVNKIKTRLCQTPTFDINSLTWGCTTKPSTTTTNLQAAFQSILTQITSIKQNLPTFSGDFVVTLNDVSDTCDGVNVALATSSVADRYVAVNVSDTTPGTLASKLEEGTGITFDVITTPGKLIINSTAVSADEKVKSRSADTVAGYLEDKMKGAINATTGITVTTATDVTDNKVKIDTTINGAQLWNFLLEFLDANPSTYTEFCERVTGCLPDCIVPPDITVIYSPATTSSTTTTTTTL